MRRAGTQFSADRLDLAWPLGGEREVVAFAEEDMTLRIKRRIAEGHIVIVDDAPTHETDLQARVYRLLTGDEARAHKAEPAGPVTRIVYHPATPEDQREYQLAVQEVQTESDRFVEAQAAALVAEDERRAEIVALQVEAEKKAATPDIAAETPVAKPEPEPEPEPEAVVAQAPAAEPAAKAPVKRTPRPRTTKAKSSTKAAPPKAN